jgi:hypothetical protein
MTELNKLSAALSEQANDQLDTLKAVKGEGFATLVAEMLNMRSVSTIISRAMDDESPVAALAIIALTELQARHMGLLQQKVGVPSDQIDEVNEWADRIYESTQRTIKAALAKKDTDSLH